MKRKKSNLLTMAGARSTAEWFAFCKTNTEKLADILPPRADGDTAIQIQNLDDGTAEICIFGRITAYAWPEYGEMDAVTFYQQLKDMGDKDITVRINSPGGSVFEGVAIYNFLKQHKGNVTIRIEGQAGSIASVIAMAGDSIQMSEASSIFIHEAATGFFGSADEFEKLAEELRKITGQIAKVYHRRTGESLEDIANWMNDETRFTGEECLEKKFCDSLFEDIEDEENEEPENKAPNPDPEPTPPKTNKPGVTAEQVAEATKSFTEFANLLE